jgi:hypothetical protein
VRWRGNIIGDVAADVIHFERPCGDQRQVHSRSQSCSGSSRMRPTYHCGELSQTLGIASRPQIDLWRPD